MGNDFDFGLDFADLVDEMFNVEDVPPVVFPAVPDVNSAVPDVNSAVPVVNSAFHLVNSAVPVVNSAVHLVNSAVPVVNSAVPVVNSAVPVVDSDVPVHDTPNPVANLLSDQEINNYIHGQKAKSTKYKDSSSLNVFRKFWKTINEQRQLTEIPPEQLDNILCQFFIRAKTTKGKLYEPDTLKG